MKVLFCLAALLAAAAAADDVVDYAKQDEWADTCQSGNSQSPVNVVVGDTTTVKTVDSLVSLSASADSLAATNANSVNALKFTFTETVTYSVPGLDNVEGTVLQLHLHWGADAETGSEHKYNGNQYNAEAHLFTSYKDGDDTKYTVLARFFKVGDENTQVGEMITAASADTRTIAGFKLSALYPSTISSVVTYTGAATTPSCDTVVHWVVVPEVLTISTAQLESLRTMKLGSGSSDAKTYNWRSIQTTGDRTFTHYKSSARAALLASPLLLLFLAASQLFL